MSYAPKLVKYLDVIHTLTPMEYETFLGKLASGKSASDALMHVSSANKHELTLDLDVLQDDAKREEVGKVMHKAFWGWGAKE